MSETSLSMGLLISTHIHGARAVLIKDVNCLSERASSSSATGWSSSPVMPILRSVCQSGGLALPTGGSSHDWSHCGLTRSAPWAPYVLVSALTRFVLAFALLCVASALHLLSCKEGSPAGPTRLPAQEEPRLHEALAPFPKYDEYAVRDFLLQQKQ